MFHGTLSQINLYGSFDMYEVLSSCTYGAWVTERVWLPVPAAADFAVWMDIANAYCTSYCGGPGLAPQIRKAGAVSKNATTKYLCTLAGHLPVGTDTE